MMITGAGFVNPDGYTLEMAKASVRKGWHPLLESLFRFINDNKTHADFKDVKIIQVKEKFGALRIYSSGSEYIFGLCDGLEMASILLCEVCGQRGSLRKERSWMLTLCDVCNQKERPLDDEDDEA